MQRLVRSVRFRSLESLPTGSDVAEAFLGCAREKTVRDGLSTYAEEEDRSLQLVSEHCVSFIRPGRTAGLFVRLTPHAPAIVRRTAGGTLFSYSNAQHRDIRFASTQELDEFIARWRTTNPTVHQHSSNDIRAYVAGRLNASDSEWMSAQSSANTEGRPAPAWFP